MFDRFDSECTASTPSGPDVSAVVGSPPEYSA